MLFRSGIIDSLCDWRGHWFSLSDFLLGENMTILMELVVQTTFSYLGTIAFAIMINIPRRALNACGLCGMAGWLTFWLLYQVGSGRMVANVMGSLILGVMGLYFARKKKMPAILFNIPGIVPLVPGATAYQAV